MSTLYRNERYNYVADRTRKRLAREGLRIDVGRGRAYRPGERTAWELFYETIGDGFADALEGVKAVVRAAKAVDAAMFHDSGASRYVTYACGVLVAGIVVLLLIPRIAQ